jgi:deazaflavin-dependent oxidoreductase (nitroreductase family)
MRALGRTFGAVGTLMFRLGVRVQGLSLLRLTTIGARTGKRRRVVLGWFPDGDRDDSWIVIASNAGARRHPGWAYNLARNPDQVWVDLGDGEVPVTPGLITGDERETVWKMVVTRSPGYGKYEEKTDRRIPLIRLTKRG